MDLRLILTYAALAYAIFRIFKIPVNSFTLLTAVLGGMFLLGALLLGMNYDHPFSSQGRFYFATTPIVPTVSGRVIEVPVANNTHVKAGEILFRLDPERYENAVKAKEAQLADAIQAWRQTFFQFVEENSGSMFYHATTHDQVEIIYCPDKEKGIWFLYRGGAGPLQAKGLQKLSRNNTDQIRRPVSIRRAVLGRASDAVTLLRSSNRDSLPRASVLLSECEI